MDLLIVNYPNYCINLTLDFSILET